MFDHVPKAQCLVHSAEGTVPSTPCLLHSAFGVPPPARSVRLRLGVVHPKTARPPARLSVTHFGVRCIDPLLVLRCPTLRM